VTAVLLAMGSALCWGVSNFIGPLISRSLPVMAVIVAGQTVALVVSAIVVVASGHPAPDAIGIGAGVLAGVGNAAGIALFYTAAATGPLSIVTPIGATGAGVPVLIGLATGERVGVLGALGILLAIGGAVLAARRASASAAEAADLRRTVMLSALSAVGFGTFLWAIAPASESGGVFWGVMLSRASMVAVIVGGTLLLGRALRVPAREVPKVALPGVLLFGGTLMYAAATQQGLLSVVAVVAALFPVVTVTLALLFLHERLSRTQWAGVASALAGVVLLSI
jgi:drug/metabolite transporter (DMT)-like permease